MNANKMSRMIWQAAAKAAVVVLLLAGASMSPVAAQNQHGERGTGKASIPVRTLPTRPKHGPQITIGGASIPSKGTATTNTAVSGEPVAERVSAASAETTPVVGSPVVSANRRAAGGPSTGVQSEISMAASGSSIVITFNGAPNGGSGFVTSLDGGNTFSANASPPTPMNSNPCCDPGIVADLIGRFYFLQIFRDDGSATHNCTNSLHVSTDGGRTFSSIFSSPFSYASGTTDFPDMPHIGIDRLNLVSGQPQLYVFTRHFTSGINCPQTGGGGSVQGEVKCSTDGGMTWTSPLVLSPFSDNAHIATGSDGSVYIASNGSGTMMNTTKIQLARSTSSCNAGLSFGSPITVADNQTFAGTTGLDREFPQPYVGVDKLNPNVAYVAWSADRLTNVADRDILLARCTFSGTSGSCEAPVRVNDNPIGDNTQQFFPMMCVDPNNKINISWDDQRAGSMSTAIYHTEITPSAGGLGVAPNSITSEVNFTPQTNFGVVPTYGDYNENNDACDANHFYVAWTSQVSPPEILPASNDPDVFFAVANNLPDINVTGPLDFGNICLGSSQSNQVEVFNAGDAPLTVNSVSFTSGSTDISLAANNPNTPVIVQPGAHVDFNIVCTPTTFGPHQATLTILSNDFDHPRLDLITNCNTPSGTLQLTGSGAFGNVCAGAQAQQTISMCNVGQCNVDVTAISTGCPDFTLVNPPTLPLAISPNSCVNLTDSFTPTMMGSKSCTLKVTSDSGGVIGTMTTLAESGNTPSSSIDVPGQFSFPATVIQSVGACNSQHAYPVSNTGTCNLTINSITVAPGAEAGDFHFAGLPSSPIILQPGHIAGEGNLYSVFAPTVVDRDRVANLQVTYVSDPIGGTTSTISTPVCGEGVLTGARVLVTAGGVPVASVDKIMLQRITGNRNKPIVDTIDVVQKVNLSTVTPASPCPAFQYHREYGTVSDPIQLLPGSYTVTVSVTIAGKKLTQTVAFDTTTCTFNPNIVVAF